MPVLRVFFGLPGTVYGTCRYLSPLVVGVSSPTRLNDRRDLTRCVATGCHPPLPGSLVQAGSDRVVPTFDRKWTSGESDVRDGAGSHTIARTAVVLRSRTSRVHSQLYNNQHSVTFELTLPDLSVYLV